MKISLRINNSDREKLLINTINQLTEEGILEKFDMYQISYWKKKL